MRKTGPVLFVLILSTADAAAAGQLRWRPVGGDARYTFTSTEQSGSRTGVIEVDVLMRSAPERPATLELLAARSGSGSGALSPVILDEACRRDFGGDQTAIGRVAMREGLDPHSAVPQCVPEDLFGAVTDLIAIMLVQQPWFGIDQLRAAGDSARFGAFVAKWSRAEPMMHASVAAPGGTIRLSELTPERALVHWRPDPMEVSIARKVAPAHAVVLHGVERFALELTIDPRSGVLLDARALEDALDLTMWAVQSDTLPPLMAMKAPGAPMTIRRTLQLKRTP